MFEYGRYKTAVQDGRYQIGAASVVMENVSSSLGHHHHHHHSSRIIPSSPPPGGKALAPAGIIQLGSNGELRTYAGFFFLISHV